MSSESIINEDQTPSTSTPKYSAESSTKDPVSSIHNSLQKLKLNSGRKLAELTLASNILTNGRPSLNLENYKILSDLEYIQKTIELTGPNKDLELSIDQIDSDLDTSDNSVFNNSIPKSPKAPKPRRKLLPELEQTDLYNPISRLRSYTRSRSLQDNIDETYKNSYNTLENLNKNQNKQTPKNIPWRTIKTNIISTPNIKINKNKMADITLQSMKPFLDQIPLFYGDKSSKNCYSDLVDFSNQCRIADELLEKVEEKNYFLKSLKFRLRGDAYDLVKNLKFETLEDLLDSFYKEYAPANFLENLQTELRYMKQNSNEKISSFIRRLDNCLKKCNECAKAILPNANIEPLNEKFAIQSLRYGIKNKIIQQQILLDTEKEYKKLKEKALLVELTFTQQEEHDKLYNNVEKDLTNPFEETNKLLLELLNKTQKKEEPKVNSLDETNKLLKNLLVDINSNKPITKVEEINLNQPNNNFNQIHQNSHRQTNNYRTPNRFTNANRNFQSNNNYRGQNNYNNNNNKYNHNNEINHNYEAYQHRQNFQNQQNSNRNQIICYKCNEIGHLTRDCRSRNINPFCRNCKKYGHNDENCQNKNVTRNINILERPPDLKCRLCRQMGHTIEDCEHNTYFQNMKFCDFCEVRGHSEEECKVLKKAENRFKSEN